MTLSDFTKGLDILRKYYDDPDGYCLGAEHDIIYVYSTDKPVSPEDLEKLFAMNWFQPDVDTGDEDLPKVEQYDLEEGWGAFV